eukprot:CAMPEP_0201113072 /NCGR_PEP_ID=MMETSP0812-20130820/77627_1 /ASSEMBLY_ACC=CAM_ASM_000668 /TAXON_ID=98059 /ORGANISM="Dinobryon sp., Strain UTEXLB2267" /LENGTH=250 /DNA_ID=CAMNT_0047376537 /DNA_START=180 /DNA_END=933 /DNA_ORIENTATION=-
MAMPLFPLSYFLALFRVFGISMSVLSFHFITMVAKGFYAAVLVDVHLDTLVVTQEALSLEQTANEARRAYLKYLFHEVRTPLHSLSIGIDILDRNPHLGEEDMESLQMMRVAADFMSKTLNDFHEVRTPLNSLSMGIDILDRNDNLNGEDMESLLMMRGAADFMSKTLNDVLSMQKIEEGKLELDMQSFHLIDAVSSVLVIFGAAAASKGLHLQQEMIGSIPCKVLGDRFRVEHVLGNLLSNAIKFSPQG